MVIFELIHTFLVSKNILNFVLLICHVIQYREKRPQKTLHKKRENPVQQAFAMALCNRYISGTKLRGVIKFHICFSHVLLTMYMKFYQNQNTF